MHFQGGFLVLSFGFTGVEYHRYNLATPLKTQIYILIISTMF